MEIECFSVIYGLLFNSFVSPLIFILKTLHYLHGEFLQIIGLLLVSKRFFFIHFQERIRYLVSHKHRQE